MVVKDQRTGEGPSASGSGLTLRQQAEERVRVTSSLSAENLGSLSPDATRRIMHELQVHQIELEMQNEELRRVQVELDASRRLYFDLYDLAPVGYCTVGDSGLIRQANLNAANLLGVERKGLIKKPISHFILREDQDNYYLFRKRLMDTGEEQSCELRMVKHDGARVWIHLVATAAEDTDGVTILRVVLTDISARKQVETALHKSEAFNLAILESLSAEIAVLDRDGRIVVVNQSWRRFAVQNRIEPGRFAPNVSVGTNYFAVNQQVSDLTSDDAANALNGIRAVVDGHLPSYSQEYPCHSPEQQRWFSMNVTP